jgi:divinyl protochlorophyllide a 8-vinyl-reductase
MSALLSSPAVARTPSPLARIGPNAITQVAAVLPAWLGSATARSVFEHAGLLHHWNQPPQSMVDEAEVRQLHLALYAALGATQAAEVAAAAGCRTADYLLAHRIPSPAQRVLKALPPGLAARALLAAVARHAWTFAGSARFEAGARLVGWHAQAGADTPAQAWMTLQHNPLLHPASGPSAGCAFYAAVFERLFRVLVHARSRVDEVACEAKGAPACRFEVRLGAP